MKSEKKPDFQKEIKVIAKADDAHGDYMTPAEIEKAANGFLKEIDKQHDFQSGVGKVVE